MSDNYESTKIRKDVKKELQKLSEQSGLSMSDVIGLSIPAFYNRCEVCDKTFIEHAFIFTHEFKVKK
jgi:hypothetical protein